MQQLSNSGTRPRLGKAVGYVAASLVFAAALPLSNPAHAAHGGGGGFHGGGFHGGDFHGDRGFHGWHGGGHGLWWGGLGLGLGLGLYPYYGYYGYSQPYAAQYWYYCSNPAGYYPQVMQCNTAWQTVPAG